MSGGTATKKTRPGQTRVDSKSKPLLVDLVLPPAARLRRLTAARVAAVCESLGEHVTTRNVQRILGGSLRDIGPLVQAWRKSREDAGRGMGTAQTNDTVPSIGFILVNALDDHFRASSLAQRSFQAELLKRLSKIEAKLTRIEAQIAQRNQEK